MKKRFVESQSTQVQAVLLGAGRPGRGEMHPVLLEAFEGTRILDWLLQAITKNVDDYQFIGGYRLNDIINKYPELSYLENADWEKTGAVGSLFKAELPEAGDLIVSYSDILYRPETVQRLRSESKAITVAVDSKWKTRYSGRPVEELADCEKVCLADNDITRLGADIDPEIASAEFIGVVKIPESIMPILKKLAQEKSAFLQKENLSVLIEWLRIRGYKVIAVDVEGEWAQLDDPRDLARFVMGTKAQTLARLRDLVEKSCIEDQFSFTLKEWNDSNTNIINQIITTFPDTLLVVRSSALNEDGFTNTNAGVFKSVLNVPSYKAVELARAIQNVAASYLDCNLGHQILVQPMIKNVLVSGVVFTRTLERGAPYYMINYDDSSGETDTITSGNSQEEKTLVLRRDAAEDCSVIPNNLIGLLPALREIESLVGYDSLDIEFAIDINSAIHILQVRPIAVDHSKWELHDDDLYSIVEDAESRFEGLQTPSPFIVGEKAVYGVMPDWNPAEIIGTNPGRLAISLYRFLIMDEAWATQRAEFGYRDVRPQPLLFCFCNRPYVDVRASFNSFIPAKINDGLAARLVDFYISWLCRYPYLHDKVEFAVVPTCVGLNFEQWEQRLSSEGGFTSKEIAKLRDALQEITVNAIRGNNKELNSIRILSERFDMIKSKDLEPLDKAYFLLEDCRRYGTVSFSHLARNAFVAITLLNSAVGGGFISTNEKDDFLNSLHTVSHDFTVDALSTGKGNTSWKSFVAKYGHLRPGTYDIKSESYAENPERYITPILEAANLPKDKKDAGLLWLKARESFFAAMSEVGLPSNADQVEAYMRNAIEGREYSKFVFTRNLSEALDCIVRFGQEHGISRDQLAHLEIEELLSFRISRVSAHDPGDWFQKRADENLKMHQITASVELPPLIKDKQDFSVFTYPNDQPNYINSGSITADCVDLNIMDLEKTKLAGKIAMIHQADPGYDWLFGQGIVGLITMYGGANSHMAIRAAEFGLPAAIGIGEKLYKKINMASVLELNAGNKCIRVVR